MKLVFIKSWTDLDHTFTPGEEIIVKDGDVLIAHRNITKYGKAVDLLPYGGYNIPLTFTLQVSEPGKP